MPVLKCDAVHVHPTYPVHSKERKSAFNVSIIAFPIPILPSFLPPTSPTLPINTHASPMYSSTPKPSPMPLGCHLCAVLSQNSTATPDWRPRSQQSTQPNAAKSNTSEKSLQRRPDATRTSSILAVVPCPHTFYSHDIIFHHYSSHF
jgi:hypothetical protein